MRSKEELIRQLEENQKQIDIQREKILQLQQAQSEKERAVAALNQKNKDIIEQEIPTALKIANIKAGSAEKLNTEDKEAVLLYIQEQFDILTNEERLYKEKVHPEKTQQLLVFLNKVQSHLNKGSKKYNRAELEKLANESNIPSKIHPANTGFDLLLEILQEKKSKYSWTYESTDHQNLTAVVGKRIEREEFACAADERYLSDIASATRELKKLQSKLDNNYIEQDKLSEEVVQLGQQITQIENVTLKELTIQAEALNQQIEVLTKQEKEQQRELERQREIERRHDLERQQEETRKRRQREILAAELKGLLDTYITDRNKQLYYQAKDLFISGDKDTRTQFIDVIGNENDGLLKAYVNSGSSEAVLKKITTEMNKFPGVNMQATLSKIVAKLMDADEQPEAVEDLPGKAKKVLLAFKAKKGKHEAYALKMENLYEKIAGIHVYADTLPEHEKGVIHKLAADLKKDVDQFVYQNQDEIPGSEAYQKFEMKVKARLHSQDDVMKEQLSWPEIIANIVFSLATIGKLIHSKATTGRATFFFDKTAKQKEIEAPVDEALEDIRTFLGG